MRILLVKEVLTFLVIFLLAMGVLAIPYIKVPFLQPVEYRTLPAPSDPVYKKCSDGNYPCTKGKYQKPSCDCPTI